MEEIYIKDWTDLQTKLFENSRIDEIKRFRSPFAFRGISDKGKRLAASIMHIGRNYASLQN
jgi:hypothetical protein